MPRYEYKVVPAPAKGQKAKGVKTPQDRFSFALQEVLNTQGGAGWEYLRAELLPSDERSGLTGSTTVWRNVLVFRRETELTEAATAVPQTKAVAVEAPNAAAPVPAPVSAPVSAATGGAEANPFEEDNAPANPVKSEPAVAASPIVAEPDPVAMSPEEQSVQEQRERNAQNLVTVSGMFSSQKKRDEN